MSLLSNQEIQLKLENAKGWNLERKSIIKDFQLKNFKEALVFVNKIGAVAEQMNHHPDILIYSWNNVKLTISTHDSGGITKKDFELAGKIDGLKS